MSEHKPAPDFFDEALNQIHRDARQGTDIPEQGSLRQLSQTIRNALDTASAPFRQHLDTAKPTQKPASPSEKELRIFVRTRSSGKSAEDAASMRRAEQSRQNRKAAMQIQAQTATPQPDPSPIPTPAPIAPTHPETNAPDTPPVKRNQRRKAKNVPGSSAHRRRAPWLPVTALVLCVAMIGTGLWLAFGYRSVDAVVDQYIQALYGGDAEGVYDLYDEASLKALALKKRFNTVEEFLASEKERFERSFHSYELSLGAEFTVDFSIEDQSEKYQTILDNYILDYDINYSIQLSDMKWLNVTAQLAGTEDHYDKEKSLVLGRIGTWWYVIEAIETRN